MGKDNKNERLIDKLTKLELERKSVRRNLNTYYADKEKRERLYKKLKQVKNEIELVKFKLRIEREIKKNDISN